MNITKEENEQWLIWMDSVRKVIVPAYEAVKGAEMRDIAEAFPEPPSREKKVGDLLIDNAYKDGKNVTSAMSEFVRWLTEIFDIKHIASGDFFEHVKEECHKHPLYGELAARWIRDVRRAMERGGNGSLQDIGCAMDWFGNVYEETFQGKGKADALGQFYTPGSVCKLISKLTEDNDNGDMVYSDCCCGSGRLLLSAVNSIDPHRFNYFIGEDIDIESVRMCALNLMIHGLRGVVVCHDSLTHEHFSVAYEINESNSPFKGMYSLRQLSEEEAEAHFNGGWNSHILKERMMVRAIGEVEGYISRYEPFRVFSNECRSHTIHSNPPFGMKISEKEREKVAAMMQNVEPDDYFDVFPAEIESVQTDDKRVSGQSECEDTEEKSLSSDGQYLLF